MSVTDDIREKYRTAAWRFLAPVLRPIREFIGLCLFCLGFGGALAALAMENLWGVLIAICLLPIGVIGHHRAPSVTRRD